MLIRKIICITGVFICAVIMPLCGDSKSTLAVLDFTTEAVSRTEMSAIVEFLSAELFNTDMFTVIDVSQRETILKEMEFSMTGCSDDSCALEIGKLLSAEMIVVGNLSKVGSRYLMSVKMLETETSKTMGTANGKFLDLDELIDGLEIIAAELATGRKETVVEAEPEVQAVEISEKAEILEKPEETAADDTAKTLPAQESPKAAEVPAPVGDEFNIGAFAITAAGVAGLGTGGFFLYNLFVNSLPAYNTALQAYSGAPFGSDFTTLFNSKQTAYDAAFSDFLIGSICAGAGVILTTVGIILFLPPSDETGTDVSLIPVLNGNPGMIVRVSY